MPILTPLEGLFQPCDAEVYSSFTGLKAITPPVVARRNGMITVTTCAPCGAESYKFPTGPDALLDDMACGALLQVCPRRQRAVMEMRDMFPWIKPPGSGTEQLEARKLVIHLLNKYHDMLGVVAGTLRLAGQNGGYAMPLFRSTQTTEGLGIGDNRGAKTHVLLFQHGMVHLERDGSTRPQLFRVLEHNAWAGFAMIPHVQHLVYDLSRPIQARRFHTTERYAELVSNLCAQVSQDRND